MIYNQVGSFCAADKFGLDGNVLIDDIDPWSPGIDHDFWLPYFLSIFPDMNMAIDDIFAEDDKVMVRSTFNGTHKGEYMGIAPTGKKVSSQIKC